MGLRLVLLNHSAVSVDPAERVDRRFVFGAKSWSVSVPGSLGTASSVWLTSLSIPAPALLTGKMRGPLPQSS